MRFTFMPVPLERILLLGLVSINTGQEPRMRLEVDGGSAEVVGVCRIEERVIECWHPDRRRFEKLEAAVAEKMSKPSGSIVNFRYGKKNRYIFVQTRQRGIYPNNPSISAVSAGVEPGGHTFLGSFEEVFGSPRQDEFLSTMVLHAVTSDEATETNVKVRIGRMADARKKVSLRPGSSFMLDGHQVRFTKTVDRSPFGTFTATPFSEMWTLYYEMTKADDREMSMGYWLPDETGKDRAYVDRRGRVMKTERLRQIWREQEVARSQGKKVPTNDYVQVTVFNIAPETKLEGRKVSGQMAVSIDPRRLRGVEAFVTYWTYDELGPVPLDPR